MLYTVCNFLSMKSPVKLNCFFLKFFCHITWFDQTQHWTLCKVFPWSQGNSWGPEGFQGVPEIGRGFEEFWASVRGPGGLRSLKSPKGPGAPRGLRSPGGLRGPRGPGVQALCPTFPPCPTNNIQITYSEQIYNFFQYKPPHIMFY